MQCHAPIHPDVLIAGEVPLLHYRRHGEAEGREPEVVVSAELAKLYGAKGEIAFGSQIRTYWMHPNQLVKDHRTSAETGSIDKVLDGDLEMFVGAYLKWNLEQESRN